MIHLLRTPRLRDRRADLAVLTVMGAFLVGCQSQGPAEPVIDPAIIDRSDDPVVARIGDDPLYQSDVIRAAIADGRIAAGEDLPVSSNGFTLTRNALIDQRLLARRAVRDGLDATPEGQRRLRVAQDRVLGNLLVERHLEAEVTEASIRALYDAQNALARQGPERRLRQIVVATEAEAEAVRARLDDEEDFAALALALSIDPASRERGGRLGWRQQASLAEPLRAPVFAARVGTRIGPIESDAGWHIIDILDARTPGARPYEEVRDDLERFLTYRALDGLIADLRERADIEIVDPVVTPQETPE